MSDLYPVSVEFENFYCYLGVHSVDLVPSCYAVIAQEEHNPSRSNWLGKSTFLMLFAYALYGWHTKRTDDEIITKGQNASRVSVRLNDGTTITRSKARGKSTQLKVTIADSDRVLTQDAAQDALERHLAMSKDQFFLVFFYRQKRIDQLVTTGGAGRSEIVDGWLAEELEPYQRLEDALARHKAENAKRLATIENEITNLVNRISIVTMRNEVAPEMLITTLIAKLSSSKQALVKAEKIEKGLEAKHADHRAKVMMFETMAAEAAKYESVVAEGVAKKAKLDELPTVTQEEISAAHALLVLTRQEHEECKKRIGSSKSVKLVTTCPVVGKPCPSADWLKSQSTDPKVIVELREAIAKLSNDIASASRVYEKLERTATERQKLEIDLVVLRTEARRLGEIVDQIEDFEEVPDDISAEHAEAKKRVVEILDEINDAQRDLDLASSLFKTLVETQEKAKTARVEADLLREAKQILNQAQQAVKETVLANIEQLANKMLESADIPLRVEFSWSQETKGLAKSCDQCGASLPDSKRVKACPSCGASRGNAVVHKLQIELSNSSGAAEDLGGLSLGIGAALWLRARRGIKWSCAFIDEPFGALDFYNKDALGTHVLGMLSQSFSSAFVVAHDRSILSSMPSRVEIVAGPNGSRIRQ